MLYPLSSQRGMSLIELVIVLIIVGILAAIAIPVFNNIVQTSYVRVTEKNMSAIERAVVGDPRQDFRGFREVVGRNPDPISELWNFSGSSYNPFTGKGDIGEKFVDASAGIDGWGNAFGWNATGNGTLTSFGADGSSGGSGFNSDIVKTLASGD